MGAFVFVLIFCGIVAAISMSAENKRTSKMSPSQRAEYQRSITHGPVNTQMVCGHCQTKGKVHTKSVMTKKGVSGGKATGALLTGGVSLLATGLSRKEKRTEAYCANCNATWHF